MKYKYLKILLFVFVFSNVFTSPLKAQYIPYDEQKADLIYAILKDITFVNDDVKTDYNIGLYGCSDSLQMFLNKNKRPRIFTGNKITISKFDPFIDNILAYDLIVVGKSKNYELDAIYKKLLKATKSGASIALFTSDWKEKDKVVFNFYIGGAKQFVKFEYNSVNMDKFNISPTASFGQLHGKDLNTLKELDKTKKNLEKTKAYLKQKEKELNKIISDLKIQKEKINAQKDQIAQQQKLIEEKQFKIKTQQNNLNNILVQMRITQQRLDLQKQNISKKDLELKEKQQSLFDFQNKMKQLQDMYVSQKKVTDQKNAQIKQISRQIDIKKKELGNLNNTIKIQRYALFIFAFLLAVIILLAVWIFRNFKKMKQQNIILEQQKNEISTQAVELEKINIELEKLSIVASETNNAVSILDNTGQFSWVNSGFTKLYGYTLQLLENEIDNNIKNTNLYSGIEGIFNEVIKKKDSAYFEHESVTRAGEVLWIQSSISPILDYNNEVKRIVLVDSNISELKEAEQQIAQQNKNIRKSIHYASRIQNATLPSAKYMQLILPFSFILYLPRDIVSGDFYWTAKVGDKIFFAAADCTGHGVPGAFMSMLGITLLNEIVSKENKDKLRPDYILNELRLKLIHALSQDEEDTKSSDGIAIAMCMLEKDKRKLHYAGAENELVLVRDNNLYDYTADDMSIGKSEKPAGDFHNQEIDFLKGDMIYLFSDGYVDQFGGPGVRRKKFLIVRLRELFLEIHNLSTEEQKDILLKKHLEWKGNNKQMDDIIIMGIRL